ncbi:hypothetical protein [Methylococcus geothermalis]|uniref:Uncharacterized protein n=1 Tax=Methylococcus geothermalis TaxID=2681310 RepID=A0A858Q8V5_9GAMM|nr:hypothetical protein [Methylococcus geothermalis]QJD30184.1 hypothetical protein GNH96_09515 [Methylococcus geothermalis]
MNDAEQRIGGAKHHKWMHTLPVWVLVKHIEAKEQQILELLQKNGQLEARIKELEEGTSYNGW